MSMRKTLFCASVLAAIAVSPILTIQAFAEDIYVTTAPPEVRAEHPPEARPGYVWAQGYQRWEGDHYEWTPGHWVEARTHSHWEADSWQRAEGEDRWHFKPGHWVED